MSREPRAIVFDLDDTLYAYRRFVRSGFLAVARHLEVVHGVNASWAFRRLLAASRGPDRGRELQVCLRLLRLSPGLLPGLLQLLRSHEPRLRLPPATARALDALRADGWRLGVLTNGSPSVQARKVAALNLYDRVDAIVYATQYGSGAGKPEAEPFAAVAAQLDVPARRVVVVGDDETTDLAGAEAAGMHRIRCAVWTPRPEEATAVPVVDRLSRVADAARALLEEAPTRHAA